MDLTFYTIYEKIKEVVGDTVIDLSAVVSLDVWVVGMLYLLAVERKDNYNKRLLLPTSTSARSYVQEKGLVSFVKDMGYGEFSVEDEGDADLSEITHSLFRDDFNARLPKIRSMFKRFGMISADNVDRATVIVGELGNNVFDHNEGSWPTDVRGAFVLGQNYPAEKKIEVVVADPGIGFRRSLRAIDSNLDDIEAIKLGLQGYTGRVGENRGNGLRLIQDWTINKMQGALRIHSGGGLAVVDKNGTHSKSANKILGTLAGLVLPYA